MCSLNARVVVCINVFWSMEKQKPYTFYQHQQIQQTSNFITAFTRAGPFCSNNKRRGKMNIMYVLEVERIFNANLS